MGFTSVCPEYNADADMVVIKEARGGFPFDEKGNETNGLSHKEKKINNGHKFIIANKKCVHEQTCKVLMVLWENQNPDGLRCSEYQFSVKLFPLQPFQMLLFLLQVQLLLL